MSADRCEPPAEHRHHRWHWLVLPDEDVDPYEWFAYRWWPTPVRGTRYAVQDAFGWRYLAPAVP